MTHPNRDRFDPLTRPKLESPLGLDCLHEAEGDEHLFQKIIDAYQWQRQHHGCDDPILKALSNHFAPDDGGDYEPKDDNGRVVDLAHVLGLGLAGAVAESLGERCLDLLTMRRKCSGSSRCAQLPERGSASAAISAQLQTMRLFNV